MTEQYFDDLTKVLARTTNRRTALKALAATAMAGVFARFGRQDAEAVRRQRLACARTIRAQYPSEDEPPTPGQENYCGPQSPNRLTCCDPDHACREYGTDPYDVCCIPEDEHCIEDNQCCTHNEDGDLYDPPLVCRPREEGVGSACQEPGLVGELCIEDEDCGEGLGCEPYTGVCEVNCGGFFCSQTRETCCTDIYTGEQACCLGHCDPMSGVCRCSTGINECPGFNADCAQDEFCAAGGPLSELSSVCCPHFDLTDWSSCSVSRLVEGSHSCPDGAGYALCCPPGTHCCFAEFGAAISCCANEDIEACEPDFGFFCADDLPIVAARDEPGVQRIVRRGGQ